MSEGSVQFMQLSTFFKSYVAHVEAGATGICMLIKARCLILTCIVPSGHTVQMDTNSAKPELLHECCLPRMVQQLPLSLDKHF